MNTIAGGGSFLTLPALMLFGLDPKIANGTNRVAVWFSSGAAAATFYKAGHFNRELANQLSWPTLLGVPVGAILAIYLPPDAFEAVFGVIFLAMAVVLIRDPKRIIREQPKRDEPSKWIRPLFFAIGIYVGFIQAGMGILVLLGMSLMQSGDLVQANAVKNWIAFLVTSVAVIMFASYGMIQWFPGLCMAAGNLLGGIVGAKLAIKKGNQLIFVFLIAVMLLTGVKLVGTNLYQWIS